jgi:hypothetical protein
VKTIERVMRWMTHVNVGATLGTGAWILWSGGQLASGALQPLPVQRPPLRAAATTPLALDPSRTDRPRLHAATDCCFVAGVAGAAAAPLAAVAADGDDPQ